MRRALELGVTAIDTSTNHLGFHSHTVLAREADDMPAEERAHLHVLAKALFAIALGETRRLCRDATVSVEGVRCPVPAQLIDTRGRAPFPRRRADRDCGR
ncbi:hypothetical protein MHW47_25435 [Streptomyces sp. OfavH-34-F]|uniref:hypothetical protein n=1 Tax=Streptomyces sp. OfavH-34-F TaxID=2917760 RepID=UPI001EF18C42|nr:hypothetical protein [Streptomyces sp. OfavH-34-F]MCG7527766.1 hypothetical protein [Streptomyces sp. OfavH-34-F]